MEKIIYKIFAVCFWSTLGVFLIALVIGECVYLLRNGEGKDYIFFTLMKHLGHSSINTTINVYSHLFPSQQKEIANAFDDF